MLHVVRIGGGIGLQGVVGKHTLEEGVLHDDPETVVLDILGMKTLRKDAQ